MRVAKTAELEAVRTSSLELRGKNFEATPTSFYDYSSFYEYDECFNFSECHSVILFLFCFKFNWMLNNRMKNK